MLVTECDTPLRELLFTLIEAEQHSLNHAYKVGCLHHKIAIARVRIAAYQEVLRLLDGQQTRLAGPPK